MQFESPWIFLFLLILPPLLWLRWRWAKAGAIRFSTTSVAVQAGRSLRQRLGFLPILFRVLALVLLIIALARPQKGLEQVRDIKKGIAIEMVVDRSGSMGAPMEVDGQAMNRLEAVKKIFHQFVAGDGHDLKGRPADLVGLITFARYPDTVCPLTLAHGALPQFLDTVQVVSQNQRSEDGTAIGDAIALAAARLKTAEDTIAQQSKLSKDQYTIKSKIMILLTDGLNNAGKRDPLQAAKLAAEWGIKIYVVGVGGGQDNSPYRSFFGNIPWLSAGDPVDVEMLTSIASTTGGIFRMAGDAEALKAIYKEIDQLERSEIQSIRYRDYKELFTPWALAAFCLVCAETVLLSTAFRRIP